MLSFATLVRIYTFLSYNSFHHCLLFRVKFFDLFVLFINFNMPLLHKIFHEKLTVTEFTDFASRLLATFSNSRLRERSSFSETILADHQATELTVTWIRYRQTNDFAWVALNVLFFAYLASLLKSEDGVVQIESDILLFVRGQHYEHRGFLFYIPDDLLSVLNDVLVFEVSVSLETIDCFCFRLILTIAVFIFVIVFGCVITIKSI